MIVDRAPNSIFCVVYLLCIPRDLVAAPNARGDRGMAGTSPANHIRFTPLREGNGDQKRQHDAAIKRAFATTLPTIVPEYLEPEAIAAGPCPS